MAQGTLPNLSPCKGEEWYQTRFIPRISHLTPRCATVHDSGHVPLKGDLIVLIV
jgi:hypothetical protein